MKFKKVYIEITNICNLNCSFCVKNQRKPQFMDANAFAHILKELKPYTTYLYFHVLGEPLLHPQLPLFLAMAKEEGFFVNLTSNGILLPDRLQELKGNIRQLNLSLHSMPLEQGCHPEDYLFNCLRCGDELAMQGTYISYRFWNQKNGHVDEESKEMLQQIMHHYQIPMVRYENQKLAEHRFLHFEEQFQWPSRKQPFRSETGTCYGLRNQCAILVDGTLVPCCLDSLGDCALGNLFEQSMAELLQQAKAQRMVSGFRQHRISEALCQRCGYRTRFDMEVKA